MARTTRRVSTSTLPGICSASIGFMLFFAGGIDSLCDSCVKGRLLKEINNSRSLLHSVGNNFYRGRILRTSILWLSGGNKKGREEEAARLQQLISSVIVPYRNDVYRKYQTQGGHTVYDNTGLIIGLSSIPHRNSNSSSGMQVLLVTRLWNCQISIFLDCILTPLLT